MTDIYPYHIKMPETDMKKQREYRFWCENTFGRAYYGETFIYNLLEGSGMSFTGILWSFKHQDDAVLFELTWG